MVAATFILFFAVCRNWTLAYPNISEAAFMIVGSIILFLAALDMPTAKWQARKRTQSTGDTVTDEVDSNKLATNPLAIVLLASPSAILSETAFNDGFAGSSYGAITGYAALIAVTVMPGFILCITVVAKGLIF